MDNNLIPIQNLIYEIRGQKVMLDSDLAKLYQIETFNLNKAVKRNIERFPEDFMFQLSNEEFSLIFQNGMSKKEVDEDICHMLLQSKVYQCYRVF